MAAVGGRVCRARVARIGGAWADGGPPGRRGLLILQTGLCGAKLALPRGEGLLRLLALVLQSLPFHSAGEADCVREMSAYHCKVQACVGFGQGRCVESIGVNVKLLLSCA